MGNQDEAKISSSRLSPRERQESPFAQHCFRGRGGLTTRLSERQARMERERRAAAFDDPDENADRRTISPRMHRNHGGTSSLTGFQRAEYAAQFVGAPDHGQYPLRGEQTEARAQPLSQGIGRTRMRGAAPEVGGKTMPRRIAEWRIHQDAICRSGLQSGRGELPGRSGNVEHDGAHAVSDAIALGVLGSQRREAGVALDERDSRPVGPQRDRQACCSDAGTEFHHMVACAGSSGGGEQDRVMPDAVTPSRLFQSQSPAEDGVVGDLAGVADGAFLL